jgi:hypothetical protein
LLIFILILSLALTGYIFGDLLFNINSYGLLHNAAYYSLHYEARENVSIKKLKILAVRSTH